MTYDSLSALSDPDHRGSPFDPAPGARLASSETPNAPGGSRRATRTSAERGVAAPQLARLRRESGLSQAELATRAGVSVATISRLEQGARAHYSTLDLLAEALGTTRTRLIRKGRLRKAQPPSGTEPVS